MRLSTEECRTRFRGARVARLATVGEQGRPHLVPVTFAVDTNLVVFAVDQKPKRTVALQRLRNIASEPAVSVLADHYDDDWSQLWWVRADGVATVVPLGDPRHAEGVELLRARYRQYRAEPPRGPVVAIEVQRWIGWAAAWPR